MAKNDEKIATLLEIIKKKTIALGDRPRAVWKTNGVWKNENLSIYDSGNNHININTLSSLEPCLRVISKILQEKDYLQKASELVGVEKTSVTWDGYTIDEWIEDFKLKATILLWNEEKKKLDALEKKLKDFRSEDAKTADAIEDIKELLK